MRVDALPPPITYYPLPAAFRRLVPMAIRATQLEVFRTAIPMRSFEHAAAARTTAEAVIVRASFSDGVIGWGETLPRPYVTGETLESVVANLRAPLWPAVRELDFAGVDAEVAARLASLPTTADGRCINAAACAVELACLDGLMRRRGLTCPAGLLATEGTPGRIVPRVTGVLGSSDPARTAKRLRLMRWFGLVDFKLKLGLGEETDAENLAVVSRKLGKALAAGRCTLRVDVNGGWTADETPGRVAELASLGVCAVEQPLYVPAGELAKLARGCEAPLIADEALLTDADADALLAEPEKVWWNVRISKNGGLLRAGRLIARAREAGATVILGCMVGETGILSAAQRRLLQAAGESVRFVEGNYGRWLLRADVVRRSPRFGYGGKLCLLGAPGLGVEVDPDRVRRWGRSVATFG